MQIYKMVIPIYVKDLEKAVAFYEEQLRPNEEIIRFHYAERNLDIAVVGQLMLISGPDEAIAKAKKFTATFIVDDVRAFKTWLLEQGAVLLQDVTKVPTGYNIFVQQPDGAVMEYVQHVDHASATQFE